MSKDKITNINKTPNDFVKEETENNPNNQQFEYTCPNTGIIKSEERNLVRVRLAQHTYWIVDEIERLKNVHRKLDVITDAIDEQVKKEKEAKENA